MENLKLYDLDEIDSKIAETQSLSLSKFDSERYQFLCNANRIRNDPIYAATPMFTTIPRTNTSFTYSIQFQPAKTDGWTNI